MERGSAKNKVARRISRTNDELRVESGSVEKDPTRSVVCVCNSWEDVPDQTRDDEKDNCTVQSQTRSGPADIFDGCAVTNHEILTCTGGRGLQV